MDIMKMSEIRRLQRLARHGFLAGILLCMLMATEGCRSKAPFGHGEVGKSVESVKLRPGLVINVSVLVAGKEEIDESAKQVSDGGTIVLPLLGELEVSDKSLDELRRELAKGYKKFFIDPEVFVGFVRDTEGEGISPWGFVTVLGRVAKPGRIAIPATRDMTVSGAIQKAGGFSSSAKDGAILVTRTMPDGTTQTRTINLYAVGAAGRPGEDIILEADDIVYVPEKMF